MYLQRRSLYWNRAAHVIIKHGVFWLSPNKSFQCNVNNFQINFTRTFLWNIGRKHPEDIYSRKYDMSRRCRTWLQKQYELLLACFVYVPYTSYTDVTPGAHNTAWHWSCTQCSFILTSITKYIACNRILHVWCQFSFARMSALSETIYFRSCLW